MRSSKLLLFFCLTVATIEAFAQSDQPVNCDKIKVNIEVLNSPEKGKANLSVVFEDSGDFTMHLIAADGTVKKTKDLLIKGIVEGDYILVITDSRNSNRCPFYSNLNIRPE